MKKIKKIFISTLYSLAILFFLILSGCNSEENFLSESEKDLKEAEKDQSEQQ